LLEAYQAKHGHPLKPVKIQDGKPVPQTEQCPLCKAPHQYLYYNDGKKRRQLLCKVCSSLFQAVNRSQRAAKAKYYCPHCNGALYRWKTRLDVIMHKCGNDNCPHRINALKQLNPAEQNLRHSKLSQFKLCYIYREYLFEAKELVTASPLKPSVDIRKIYNSPNVLGLILSFFVSFAISARKTAYIMRAVFNVNVSHQTVLNYAEAAAFHCHQFNMKFKGPIDNESAGDETYIKIAGKTNFVFLFTSAKRHTITSYHVADNRETLPAIITMNEAIRTAEPDQKLTLITDGNPSYVAGLMFLNEKRDKDHKITLKQVIGLQNLDETSAEFRPFKQIIERLNRTFKFHVRASAGFKAINGAVCLTTLIVTHYNFLRPHISLDYKVPIEIPELQAVSTIQGRWAKILSMAV
jgi:transposase-like protein